MVLFCYYLWKQRTLQFKTINRTRVVVMMTSDIPRKNYNESLGGRKVGCVCEILLHDEVENTTFTELASLSAHVAILIPALK